MKTTLTVAVANRQRLRLKFDAFPPTSLACYIQSIKCSQRKRASHCNRLCDTSFGLVAAHGHSFVCRAAAPTLIAARASAMIVAFAYG